MFNNIFKNTSIALRFVFALSSVLIAGCVIAIVLLQFKETWIVESLLSVIKDSFIQSNSTLSNSLLTELTNNIDTVIAAFIFELSLLMIGIAIFVITSVYVIFTMLVRKRPCRISR